ncbi:MAG: glycosyltransferase family 4 protein [Myxococcota bacterium]
MRIGLIIYGELTQHPGNYLYDRYLVRGLSKLGHSLDVISLPKRDYGRHLLDNFSPRLRRQLRKAELDVLLQDETNHPSLFQLNRGLRARGEFPIISIVHGLRSSQPWSGYEARLYRSVERDYLSAIDGVILKSKDTRDEIQQLLGHLMPWVVAQPGRDHVSPDLDEARVHARAHESGPLRLLFLGDVIAAKGLHFLLAGLASMPKRSVQLDVVGDLQQEPSYVRDTQATIVREGLTQTVTLWGTLKGSSLLERLRSAHVLAVTSEGEGFTTAYLEGLGFFLPVLASHDGAVRELVHHEREGFLVNRRNPEAIAGALGRWSSDRDLLYRMGRAARERYLRQPTWDQMAERVAAFLEERVQRFSSKASSAIER